MTHALETAMVARPVVVGMGRSVLGNGVVDIARTVDRGDTVAAAAAGNDQCPPPGTNGALDALAADIPAAKSPCPVPPDTDASIGLDRTGESDDQRAEPDPPQGFGQRPATEQSKSHAR